MSIKKKILILITIICISVIGGIVIAYNINLNNRPGMKAVLSCKTYYGEGWKLNAVSVDDEKKTVVISFQKKSLSDEWKQRMGTAYIAMYNTLLNDMESRYKDYTVRIGYTDHGDYVDVSNIDRNLQSVELTVGNDRTLKLTLKELAEIFPGVRGLNLLYISDGKINIDDLAEFSSLEYIKVRADQFSDEDKKYIKSIHPDIKIKEIGSDSYTGD